MPSTKEVKENKFNPSEHLLELKHKAKQPDGSYKEVTTMYLPVAWRMVWMRAERPEWQIITEIIANTDMFAIVKASIYAEGFSKPFATAHKREDKIGLGDYLEKAETGAIGRCLAMCGYGTQFAPDLDEGQERVVDAPVTAKNTPEGKLEDNKATLKQLGKIRAMYAERDLNVEAMKQLLKKEYKIDSHKDLTVAQASEWIGKVDMMEGSKTEYVDPKDVNFDGGL